MKLESRNSSLQELYAEESARIQARFEETGDGKAVIRERTALIVTHRPAPLALCDRVVTLAP